MELTILGLNYQLGPNRVFHDDGYVNSVLAHRRQLDVRYGCLADENNYKGPIFSGEHALREEKFRDGTVIMHNHIYYINHGFVPSNLNTRGHEETHAVEFDGMLELLAERIFAEQGIKIDFADIGDGEVKAEIGGIFALYRWGFRPGMLKRRTERPREDYFDAALDIYERSRLPNRTIFIPRKLSPALEPRLGLG